MRAEVLLRIAHMQEERLGDRTAAAATLREACEIEPTNMRLLRELVRVLDAVGDVRGLVEALARQVGLCADAERAAVLLRMGRLLETSLAQPARATDAYLQALEADPISAEAVEGLERLFAAGLVRQEDIAKVAGRLLPYYELTERFDKWAGMLEALVSVTADRNERRAHLELLADLYQGPLADAAAAFGTVLRVFEMEPANPSVRERLVPLAVDAGKLPASRRDRAAGAGCHRGAIPAAGNPHAHRRGRGAPARAQERGRSGPARGPGTRSAAHGSLSRAGAAGA